jgi:small-conductance mechanosensitive channel
MMMGGIAFAIAALVLAALLHRALARASRRIPRWLARRRGLPVGRELPHQRSIAFAAIAFEVAIWSLALGYAVDHLAPLASARDEAVAMLRSSAGMALFSLEGRPFTVLDLITLPLLLLAVWIGTGALVRVARHWTAAVAGAGQGAADSASILARYALAAVGFVLVLQGWGVDVRSLAIVASVLGVGIGFGLQNIANNFVSGLLLNIGRAIQPGDFVEVGEFRGAVRRIGARSTEILTRERVTIFVPNSRFLEQEVVNWTHGDPRCEIAVPIGVAYGSDLRAVRRALLAAAEGHRSVLRDPRPTVELRGFGASSLDLELQVWTSDPRRKDELTSDLNFRIEASLRRHGIEIPFAQHDLHLRSPSLERLVEAWRAPAGVPAPAASPPVFDLPHAPAVDELREGPESWDEAAVRAVGDRLRGGIEIRDRRHLLSVHRSCFVGREAVDWLVSAEDLTRAEAVALGQRWIEIGLIQHVLDEHDFRDGYYFYRFRDGTGRARATG